MGLKEYLLEGNEYKCKACGYKQEFQLTPSDKQKKCPKCGTKMVNIDKAAKLDVRKNKY